MDEHAQRQEEYRSPEQDDEPVARQEQIQEVFLEGLEEDNRVESGIPNTQQTDELAFIQMTGLTRPPTQPAEQDRAAEDALDPTSPISFYEEGVADVDESASGDTPARHETGLDDQPLVESPEQLGEEPESANALKALIAQLGGDTGAQQPAEPEETASAAAEPDSTAPEPETEMAANRADMENAGLPETEDQTGSTAETVQEAAEEVPENLDTETRAPNEPELGEDLDALIEAAMTDEPPPAPKEDAEPREPQEKTAPSDTPVENTTLDEEPEPVDEPLVDKAALPAEESPAEESPAEESPAEEAPAEEEPAEEAAHTEPEPREETEPPTLSEEELPAADAASAPRPELEMAFDDDPVASHGTPRPASTAPPEPRLHEAEYLLNELEQQPRERAVPEAAPQDAPDADELVYDEYESEPRFEYDYSASPARPRRSRRRSHRRRKLVRRLTALAVLVLLAGGALLAYEYFLQPVVLDANELYAKGVAELETGAYLAASDTFSAFVRRFPEDTRRGDAQFQAAWALQRAPTQSQDQRRDNARRALAIFQEFVEANPAHAKRPRAECLMGVLHYSLGEHEKAVELLRTPSRQAEDPDAALPLLRILARSYAKLGQYEQAESAYLQAATLPHNYTPDVDYYELGAMYKDRAETAEASSAKTALQRKAAEYWGHAIETPTIDPAVRDTIRKQMNWLPDAVQAGTEPDASGSEAAANTPPETGTPPAAALEPAQKNQPEPANQGAATAAPVQAPDPDAEAAFLHKASSANAGE